MARPANVPAPEGWMEALAGHVPAGSARLSQQVEAIAARFGVHERTVWRWVRPPHRVPRRVAAEARGAVPRERQLEQVLHVGYYVAAHALNRATAAGLTEETQAPAVVAMLGHLKMLAALLEPHVPGASRRPSRAVQQQTERLLQRGKWSHSDGAATTAGVLVPGVGGPYHRLEVDSPEAVPLEQVLRADELAYTFAKIRPSKP